MRVFTYDGSVAQYMPGIAVCVYQGDRIVGEVVPYSWSVSGVHLSRSELNELYDDLTLDPVCASGRRMPGVLRRKGWPFGESHA